MKTIISKYFMNDMSNNFFFNQIQILIAYISVKKITFVRYLKLQIAIAKNEKDTTFQSIY